MDWEIQAMTVSVVVDDCLSVSVVVDDCYACALFEAIVLFVRYFY